MESHSLGSAFCGRTYECEIRRQTAKAVALVLDGGCIQGIRPPRLRPRYCLWRNGDEAKIQNERLYWRGRRRSEVEERNRCAQCTRSRRKVEDIDSNLKGDFVVCLQTIGFNIDFELDNSIIAIKKCVEATRADGLLVINIGFRAGEYFSQIGAVLRQNFKEVETRTYGALRKRRNPRVSYLLASAMYRAPWLATLTKDLNKFFICRGKNSIP